MKLLEVLFIVALFTITSFAALFMNQPVRLGAASDAQYEIVTFSINSKDLQDYYWVFVNKNTKPFKLPIDITDLKYDEEIVKPQLKLWMDGKDTFKKAEFWFRHPDQLKEYLR